MDQSGNESPAIAEKPDHTFFSPAQEKSLPSRRSGIFLLATVFLAVFVCEALVMVAIRPFYHLQPWLIAVIDAFLLVVLVSPVLYRLLFLPLVRHIEERERAEWDLQQSEMRMRTVFRTSPDSISISRLENGAFVDVNEGFTALSGYSRGEVLGRSSLDIPLWVDARQREMMIDRLQKAGRATNFEARFQTRDAAVVDALISARIILLDEEPHILAITRDISALKRTERSLRASRNFLRISNRHRKMDALLREFVAEIRRLTGCVAVGMRIRDEKGGIPYEAYEGYSPQFYESENQCTLESTCCLCSDVIAEKAEPLRPFFSHGGSFRVDSASRFLAALSDDAAARLCGVCSRYGYESVALVPIRLRDDILGLIHVADPREGAMDDGAIEILEDAALQLGTAIERIIAMEALEASHHELERRVTERTQQLVEANEMLSAEIKERQMNEEKLLEQQKKMRALSSELLLTGEKERRRIATELHDRIGQTLAVSRIKLGQLKEDLVADVAASSALEEVRRYIEQTIEDTRSLTFELSPPVLYELGLVAAVKWLADILRTKHGLKVDVKDDGRDKPLAEDCRVIAFQAARELLLNVLKHAGAGSVNVSIESCDGVMRIDIQDDGIGFEYSKLDPTDSGFGLFSIRERLQGLNGRLEIDSESGIGTRASLFLPLTGGMEEGKD